MDLHLELDRSYFDALRSLARSKNTPTDSLAKAYLYHAILDELTPEGIEHLGDFEKTSLRRLVNRDRPEKKD